MADPNTHDPTYELEDLVDVLSDPEVHALADAIVHQYLVLPESWSPFPFLTTLYCVRREMQRLPAVVVWPKRASSRRIAVANLDKDWLQEQYELVVRSGGIVDRAEFDPGGFGALVEENQAEELARLLVKPLGKNVSDPPPELGELKAPRRSRIGRCGHHRTSKKIAFSDPVSDRTGAEL